MYEKDRFARGTKIIFLSSFRLFDFEEGIGRIESCGRPVQETCLFLWYWNKHTHTHSVDLVLVGSLDTQSSRVGFACEQPACDTQFRKYVCNEQRM